MLPSSNFKKIKIHITTYNKKKTEQKGEETKEVSPMCSRSCKKDQKINKFVCPLCLNEELAEDMSTVRNGRTEMKRSTCPFCHKDKACIADAYTCTELKIMDFNKEKERKCLCKATETGSFARNVAVANKDVEVKTVTNKSSDRIKARKESVGDIDDVTRQNETKLFLAKQDSSKISKKLAKEEDNKRTPMYYKVDQKDDSKSTVSEITVEEVVKEPQSCCRKALCCFKNEKCERSDSGSKSRNEKEISTDMVCQKTGSCQVMEVLTDTMCFNDGVTQTSKAQIDLNNGLNLLNEVLTVFQNKKCEPKSCDCRLNSDCKDASIQATEGPIKKTKSLTLSKLVKYSISEEKTSDQPRSSFVILEARQPDVNKSKSSLRLAKHKSSSIPQMKLEELKYSMKEKTKSKDTVHEVNRMFAVVAKYDRESKDDTNRPAVRSGPRILPVVKTDLDYGVKKETKDNFSEISTNRQIQDTKTKLVGTTTRDNYSEVSKSHEETEYIKCCKNCQTNDYYMSGGDSKGSCSNGIEERACEKCVYMLSCCHNRSRGGMLVCECCMKKTKNCRCSRNNCLMGEKFQNSTNF